MFQRYFYNKPFITVLVYMVIFLNACFWRSKKRIIFFSTSYWQYSILSVPKFLLSSLFISRIFLHHTIRSFLHVLIRNCIFLTEHKNKLFNLCMEIAKLFSHKMIFSSYLYQECFCAKHSITFSVCMLVFLNVCFWRCIKK